jgi:hypothetical protein
MAKAVEESARPKPMISAPSHASRPNSEGQPREHEAGEDDLREAEPENVVAHRPEAGGLQLQPDQEEQEDDAEFGDAQQFLPVADLVQDRADHHAGGEVAEDGAEPEPLEDRRGEQRPAEHQQNLVVRAVGIGHAEGFLLKERGNAAKKERPPLMPVRLHNKWGSKERPSHVRDDRFRKPSRACR